mmetsp:Transcript_11419/g.30557  ORF Transcript_11419/g.30557 Transcript_11419/m.30557 type:complete len:271 (+) Transcript_11419:366-1178(+)
MSAEVEPTLPKLQKGPQTCLCAVSQLPFPRPKQMAVLHRLAALKLCGSVLTHGRLYPDCQAGVLQPRAPEPRKSARQRRPVETRECPARADARAHRRSTVARASTPSGVSALTATPSDLAAPLQILAKVLADCRTPGAEVRVPMMREPSAWLPCLVAPRPRAQQPRAQFGMLEPWARVPRGAAQQLRGHRPTAQRPWNPPAGAPSTLEADSLLLRIVLEVPRPLTTTKSVARASKKWLWRHWRTPSRRRSLSHCCLPSRRPSGLACQKVG